MPKCQKLRLRGGPFDNWGGGGGGGVEENLKINKIFFILLKINKMFSTLLKINKLFLDMSKKNKMLCPPPKKVFSTELMPIVWPVGYILITSLFMVELRPELS